ncbi:hypothetical protein AYO20_06874 [Fonsecaea nubica]|uniref:Uncharacterized protein n=1 Tax=Fonsecaea nubica TaxID=856822 RepID=A0A178CXT6_9EURO|nr:hypothetical protein AYO20_06874 [Fonsecaea nubica]OAL33863.1 hypothetical protein AYO20_06874 [Fonsecaea nubica]
MGSWPSANYEVEADSYDAGSPARIGPSLLVTDDPELLRHMSAPRANHIFSERDERRHAEMRSKTIGAVNPPELYAFPVTLVLMVLIVLTGDKYSGKEVDALESDIDENLQRLLALIRRQYNGKPLDMSLVASFFTLDVLSQIAFGDAFGFFAAKRDLYNLNEIANQFFKPADAETMGSERHRDEFGQGRIIGIAQKAVAERYRPGAKVKRDILGHVAKGLSQTQVEAESHLQIIAGSDSTSSALRITMMLLIGSPVASQKLVTEIDRAVANGKISCQIVRCSEAAELEYLSACIWEGIRMFPPLFGLLSNLAPPEGGTVNGVFFPPGTEVAFCCEGVGRRTDVFGADADLYRPDRWLQPDPEVKARYLRTADLTFGSGRLACLGKSIAMMEVHKAFVGAASGLRTGPRGSNQGC